MQYSFSLVRESGESAGFQRSGDIDWYRSLSLSRAADRILGPHSRSREVGRTIARGSAEIEKPWTCTLEFARSFRRGRENAFRPRRRQQRRRPRRRWRWVRTPAQGCRDGLSAEPVPSRDIRHTWLSSASARAWTSARPAPSSSCYVPQVLL